MKAAINLSPQGVQMLLCRHSKHPEPHSRVIHDGSNLLIEAFVFCDKCNFTVCCGVKTPAIDSFGNARDVALDVLPLMHSNIYASYVNASRGWWRVF